MLEAIMLMAWAATTDICLNDNKNPPFCFTVHTTGYESKEQCAANEMANLREFRAETDPKIEIGYRIQCAVEYGA